jgi:hypothetical protein
MRSKYVRTNANIPQIQAKQIDSPLWKAIYKEWFHVIKGISWAIGNGENVKFWQDEWLDEFGSLVRYVA